MHSVDLWGWYRVLLYKYLPLIYIKSWYFEVIISAVNAFFLPLIMYFFLLLIWKAEVGSWIKPIWSSGSLPDSLKKPWWGQVEARCWEELNAGLPCGCQGAIICCFPGWAKARSWNYKRNEDLKPRTLIWDVGAPSGILMAAPNTWLSPILYF